MSADANSAFGNQIRPGQLSNESSNRGRTKRTRADDRRLENLSTESESSTQRSTSLNPQQDTSSLSVPFPSSIPAKTTPIHRPEWHDQPQDARPLVDTLPQRLQSQIQAIFSDQVTPVRLASHLSVLAVAALILIISQVDLPNWNFSLRALPNSALLSESTGGSTRAGALINGQANAVIASNESLQRAAVPFTIIHQEPQQEPQEGIQAYTVQAGDTVLGIAEKFGLQPETIQWSNSTLELNADLIRPGDQINILPVDGVLHTVAAGDTLSSLASKYKVDMEAIVSYPLNGMGDALAPLVIGRQIVIPGGVKPAATRQAVAYTAGSAPATAKVGSGSFVWPTSGSINQRYWGGHGGVDIGGWTGAPVKAADGGYVAVATGGWNGGYGNHVIIDHGNGFVTLYAHLNSIYVRPGENVARGASVGSVGNTGNSTGPHLHFEIRYQGVPRNPSNYLP